MKDLNEKNLEAVQGGYVSPIKDKPDVKTSGIQCTCGKVFEPYQAAESRSTDAPLTKEYKCPGCGTWCKVTLSIQSV